MTCIGLVPADISEFAGTEDITIDADNGIAFISVCDFHTLLVSGTPLSHNRQRNLRSDQILFATLLLGKAEDGGIFIYDLANSKTEPQERLHRLQPVGLPSDLSFKCPHGIGLWPPSSAAHPELGMRHI